MSWNRCEARGCSAMTAHRHGQWCRTHHPRRCEAPTDSTHSTHYGRGRCCNVVSVKAIHMMDGRALCAIHGGPRRELVKP